MKKNIAVIGCGYWGQNLVRCFSELGSLYAICDANHDQLQNIADKFDVKALTFDDVLNNQDIEGIALAAPAHLHADLGIKVMNAGKNLFVEKPIALNISEAKNMIKIAENRNIHLMVGHLLQYHNAFIKLKECISSGMIGDMKHIISNRKSFGKIRLEENVLWSFAPHDISMVLSLAKQSPIDVQLNYSSPFSDKLADIANVYLKFESGLTSEINVSWLSPFKEHKLSVIGTKGSLVFDDILDWNKKLALINHQVNISKNSVSTSKSTEQYIRVEEREPLKEECSYFLKLIAGEVVNRTDGIEGLKVLDVLHKAEEAIINEK